MSGRLRVGTRLGVCSGQLDDDRLDCVTSLVCKLQPTGTARRKWLPGNTNGYLAVPSLQMSMPCSIESSKSRRILLDRCESAALPCRICPPPRIVGYSSCRCCATDGIGIESGEAPCLNPTSLAEHPTAHDNSPSTETAESTARLPPKPAAARKTVISF